MQKGRRLRSAFREIIFIVHSYFERESKNSKQKKLGKKTSEATRYP